jgi:hypothetical protein
MAEVRPIVVPQFEEFAVKTMWAKVKKDADLLKYFPDYKKGKLPNRDFFYTVCPPSFKLTTFF